LNRIPPAVNWHFWPRCNYGCEFCFATFEDISLNDRLSKSDALLLPNLLAEAGAEKITFVGGEPTLCPYLDELLEAAKKAGLTTCIVTNGTGISRGFLESNSQNIDWIGLSIDASNDIIHHKIGRGLIKDLNAGFSEHLIVSKSVWNLCKEFGIRMKLNTVVCKQNVHDDMSKLVSELMPERWKIFQVLPVTGQNDLSVDELLISEEEFSIWVKRHRDKIDSSIDLVAESNDLMTGSYVMIDALGRFYSNVKGGHTYTPSILEIGVMEAWELNQFKWEQFHNRGGLYDWKNNIKLPML
jgi:radical S-adenosyl methionine domain-containing protein 2